MAEMTASTMSGLFSGMSAVSSGISAVSQYKKGQAERAAYDYNANITLENMKQEEISSEQKYAELMGRQRSLYAKAGVDITSGSPLLIAVSTAMQEEEEQQRIKTSGESQATMQRYAGEVAEYAGTTGAMTTFLTGLGQAGLGYELRKKGVSQLEYL